MSTPAVPPRRLPARRCQPGVRKEGLCCRAIVARQSSTAPKAKRHWFVLSVLVEFADPVAIASLAKSCARRRPRGHLVSSDLTLDLTADAADTAQRLPHVRVRACCACHVRQCASVCMCCMSCLLLAPCGSFSFV